MPSIPLIRPLGPLRWIMPKLALSERWSVIGAISAEDRCLAASTEIVAQTSQSDVMLLHIDPDERSLGRWLAETRSKREINLRRARQAFGQDSIRPAGSLSDIDHDIADLADDIAKSCSSHVVLDISTMPKRFFFTLLTKLTESPHITTLIATNTTPEAYGKVLARDAADWSSLPIYCGESDEASEATLIIGVGYHALNVREILERYRTRRVGIKLFLPFPSLHPGFIPNWKFIHGIKSEWDKVVLEPIEIVRVPTHDVSLAFDRLLQHSSGGKAESLVLAPFGPKSLSLAMCLLGIARTRAGCFTEIGYTQPSAYSPDYSTGIAIRDGAPVATAYCVRLNGRDLYQVD